MIATIKNLRCIYLLAGIISLLLCGCKENYIEGDEALPIYFEVKSESGGIIYTPSPNNTMHTILVTPPGGSIELECTNRDLLYITKSWPDEVKESLEYSEGKILYELHDKYYDIISQDNGQTILFLFHDIPDDYSDDLFQVVVGHHELGNTITATVRK